MATAFVTDHGTYILDPFAQKEDGEFKGIELDGGYTMLVKDGLIFYDSCKDGFEFKTGWLIPIPDNVRGDYNKLIQYAENEVEFIQEEIKAKGSNAMICAICEKMIFPGDATIHGNHAACNHAYEIDFGYFG